MRVRYESYEPYLPRVFGEAPLVGLQDLLPSGELELRTPEGLDRRGTVVVLGADGDDDLGYRRKEGEGKAI